MLTGERLAELERAAAECIETGHPEWVLAVRADELAVMCRTTRWAALRAAYLQRAERKREVNANDC